MRRIQHTVAGSEMQKPMCKNKRREEKGGKGKRKKGRGEGTGEGRKGGSVISKDSTQLTATKKTGISVLSPQ